MKEQIKNTHVTRYNYSKGADDIFVVMTTDMDGRNYYHPHDFKNRDDALKLVAKVSERGFIESELWECHVPYGSKAYILDGHEERMRQDELDGLYG
tara:strand:- start:319 stop:606 length:288 start_codon:yes stop_codon:yes gene_type:complete